ncbi:MAG: DegV family protein [Limnochordia bacterium]|jgi:DegV family protein with EDD domain|nr:DegV family protein [Limnochordia bacterium]
MTNKIKLFTDSAADLPQIYRDRYDIGVVPLSVIFGDTEFKDGVTLSPAEFWMKLQTSTGLPSTNQVNPNDFVEAFTPFIEEGCTILYVGLSAKLSGTLQSAVLAKDLINTERIHIFDSRSASIGETLLLITAGEMSKNGHSLAEIQRQLEQDREESFAYFTIDSLTHLVKGGRLTKTQGIVGSMLSVKPILQVTSEGTIEVAEKVRSTKKALQTMVSRAKERNIDVSKKRVAIVHTWGAETIPELTELVMEELAPLEIVEGLIGPTIGTHAGPGGIALFF